MDQKVFFYVTSHGYEYPADGFGFRGVALDVKRGGRAQLKIKRRNIAERLYRVTGAGIYRDSVLVGRKAPIARPLLNAQVTGSDSVQMAQYRGRLFWIWGDTNRPRYPLGNFHVPGATSRLPADGGLDPARGDRPGILHRRRRLCPTRRARCPAMGQPGSTRWFRCVATSRSRMALRFVLQGPQRPERLSAWPRSF